MPGTTIFRLRRPMFHAVVDFAGVTPEPSERSSPCNEAPTRPQSLPTVLRQANGRLFPGWGPEI
jgi:hypothetical protein